MNRSIYDAVCGISEEYLTRSEDFEQIKSEFKKSKRKRMNVLSSVCLLLAAAAATVSLGHGGYSKEKTAREEKAVVFRLFENSAAVRDTDVSGANSVFGSYEAMADAYWGDMMHKMSVIVSGRDYHQLPIEEYRAYGLGEEAKESFFGEFIGNITEANETLFADAEYPAMSYEPSLAGAEVYYCAHFNCRAAVIVKTDANCAVFVTSSALAYSSFKEDFEYYGASGGSDVREISVVLSVSDGAVYRTVEEKTVTDRETIASIVKILFELEAEDVPEDPRAPTPHWFTDAMEKYRSGDTKDRAEQIMIAFRFSNGMMMNDIMYLPHVGSGYISGMKELTKEQNEDLRALIA